MFGGVGVGVPEQWRVPSKSERAASNADSLLNYEKVKSAYEPSGPSGQSLSRFL